MSDVVCPHCGNSWVKGRATQLCPFCGEDFTKQSTPEVAQSIDEVTARVNLHIHEEVEKRVTAWLQASHGVDFVEKLTLLNQSNATLRKHNRQMFLLIKECYAYMWEAMRALPSQPESEPPLIYKIRLLIESVEGKAKKGPRIIT